MSRRSLLLVSCLGAAALLAPAAGRAHGIESSLQRLGGLSESLDFSRTATGGKAPEGSLQLETRFSNGLPATEATVRMVSPEGGEPIEVGHTDASGRLTFSLPPQAAADWEVQVDAGPGHRDYLELPGAAETPQTLPGRPLPQGLRRLSREWGGMAPLVALGLLGSYGGLRRKLRRR
jgi:nickel transport protein